LEIPSFLLSLGEVVVVVVCAKPTIRFWQQTDGSLQ
jgi:hypothetical protein